MQLFASKGWDNVQAECNTGDGLVQVNECPAMARTARCCAVLSIRVFSTEVTPDRILK